MKALRIDRVAIYKLELLFVAPFRIALGEMDRGPNLLVRIETDAGLSGMGEACPAWFVTGEFQDTAYLIAQKLAHLLLGKDPLALQARLGEIDGFMVKNPTIKSAFDLALYDLAAQHAGLPLYAYLGGEKRRFHTNFTMGIAAPEAMAETARRYQERGAQSMKIKLGEGDETDIERVLAIRAAIGGDIPLRLDANQAWSPRRALRILNAIADQNIEFCEQPGPHWDLEGMRWLRERSPIPIMADESLFGPHEAFQLAQMGACDIFNIKLAKCGGIHGALAIDAIAAAAGIPCMLGGMAETRLGVSAAAHFVAARPNVQYADLDSICHYREDPYTSGVSFEGAQVVIPDLPGHGAALPEAYLRELESVTVRAGK